MESTETPEPDERPDVDPTPEPDGEQADQHTPPLDDDEDARHLDPADPRRLEAEERRGRPFDQEEGDVA